MKKNAKEIVFLANHFVSHLFYHLLSGRSQQTFSLIFILLLAIEKKRKPANKKNEDEEGKLCSGQVVAL